MVIHRHPSWPWKTVTERYFTKINENNFVFKSESGLLLTQFSSYKIRSYIPIKYEMVKDNPNCDDYFKKRNSN